MSTLDPYAALFAVNAQMQAADLDLTLGLPLDSLVAQLRIDDVLAAIVLPPANGQDLLEILGQTIVAQLPPTVRPGDTLLLQVTNVSSNQVIVRNLGTLDPEQPLPPQVLQAPQNPPNAPAPSTVPAQTSVAPPREVFVAASVIRAPLPGKSPQAAPAMPPAGHAIIEARITAARATAGAPVAQSVPQQPVLQQPVPQLPPVIARRVSAFRTGTPEAVLQSVNVPRSTLMLSAARIANDAVRRLPEVLARLERALQPVANDARTSTLRTIVSFVTHLDPRNEEALPQQIASYVSNVLEGAEKKVATLIRAHLDAQPQEKSAAPRVPQAVADAKTLERSVAIEHDLKSLVLSLVSRPPAQHTPELAQTLRDAVVTLSGAQLHALQQNAQTPNAMSFALPMFFHENGQPAQIRIQRDGGKGAQSLDGDNFHVAFVLDTSSLGTVSVELQSGGRSVTVNVRTESERQVPAFKSTLADLVTRLEKLRYRVARTSAQAAPVTPRVAQPQPVARTASPAKPSGLDLRA